MTRKLIYLAILLSVASGVKAQHAADTAGAIRAFEKVMGFAVQPYLYYTSVTSIRYGPMAGAKDSGSLIRTRFYKVGDDLYYGNDQEETYMQDSLLIRINHLRKSIMLSRVDISTKKNLDLLPLKRQNVQKLFRQRYSIAQSPDRGDTGRIVISSHERMVMRSLAGADILIIYSKPTNLPIQLQATYRIREEPSQDMMNALQGRGYDVARMTVEENGVKSLVMTETASVRFDSIGIEKEQAMKMPWWREEVSFDKGSGVFSGKGACEGYEVIKTF